MDNAAIADIFSLYSKLLDIHGENGFRAKTYANAAFQIDKLTIPLATVPQDRMAGIKGIGESVAAKVQEILSTGALGALDELIRKTPPGVIQMMQIKGLGPKKLHTVWKEMEIESIGELLYACNENRLTLYKGFGEKTQQNIIESIEFLQKHQDMFLYAEVAAHANAVRERMEGMLAPHQVILTGGIAMHEDTVDRIDLITDAPAASIIAALAAQQIDPARDDQGGIIIQPEDGIKIRISSVDTSQLVMEAFQRSSSPAFLDAFLKRYPNAFREQHASEAAMFSSLSLPYLPPHLRHHARSIDLAASNALPTVIETKDIKGIIHTHSTWSDGSFSIEDMARHAMQQGFEYLVISDHSKTAFYANGLQPDRIKAQHQQIDALNERLAPFKIFKSIESDILNDGELDYDDALLSTFDLVIASVHSNLKMTEEKAMQRLMKAIQNPYTTILGHMTGRLLLSRKGYPVDHRAIIDACVAHHVVIELNAHPRRLDMDHAWIPYALEKGALISIDPDAHTLDGFDDIRYGVIAAQKGLLTPASNLSSFSLAAFEQFLAERRRLKGI